MSREVRFLSSIVSGRRLNPTVDRAGFSGTLHTIVFHVHGFSGTSQRFVHTLLTCYIALPLLLRATSNSTALAQDMLAATHDIEMGRGSAI